MNLKYDRYPFHVKHSTADCNSFVALDFETTGLYVQSCEIIEIGAVKVLKGKMEETYQTLVKPEDNISSVITGITGITNDMVKDAPRISDVILKLKEFIGDLPIVAHNARFDIKFLDYNLAKIDEDREYSIYDTLALARKYFRGLPSYRLTCLSDTLNLRQTTAHRALADAEAAARLYMMCFEKENAV